MNRFSRIPNPFYPNVIKDVVQVLVIPKGKRIVDDTYYVPNKEANKILAKQQAGQLLDDLLFDNPKDIERGAVNVYARQKGRDLAELTQQARQLSDKVNTIMTDIHDEILEQASRQVSSSVLPGLQNNTSE